MRLAARRWAVAWRIVIALAALGAAAWKSLIDLKVFAGTTQLGIALVVFPASLVAVESIRSAVAAYRRPQTEQDRNQILLLLRGAILTISDVTHVPEREIGANLFRIRRAWYAPWNCHLHRMLHERMSFSPQPSSVKWTRGKGVIGAAWENRQTQVANLTRLPAELAAVVDEATFQLIDESTRGGFTYAEFQGLRGKYAEALASPVLSHDGTRVIGVVSFDIPSTVRSPAPGALLDDARVIGAAEEVSSFLANSIERA